MMWIILTIAQGEYHPEWYDSPLARLTVPEELIETAKDPDVWEQFYAMSIEVMAPVDAADLLYLFRKQGNASFERNSASALRRMYNAGIPIAMGSDSGDWAIVPNQFHGLGTIQEIS